MTVRLKLTLLLGALVSLNVAAWGLRQILAGAFDPLFKAMGS